MAVRRYNRVLCLLTKLFHTIKYHLTAHRPDKYGLLHCSLQNQKSPSKTFLTEISSNLLLQLKLGSILGVLSALKQTPHGPGKTFLSDAIIQNSKIGYLNHYKQD